VNFSLAASQNGDCIAQQWQIMILFHDCSMKNDESNKKNLIFVLPFSAQYLAFL
jgi:hypothetical protein